MYKTLYKMRQVFRAHFTKCTIWESRPRARAGAGVFDMSRSTLFCPSQAIILLSVLADHAPARGLVWRSPAASPLFGPESGAETSCFERCAKFVDDPGCPPIGIVTNGGGEGLDFR